MIRYALRCKKAHRFDSWFGSSADFDRLHAGGLVSCAVCGSGTVEKTLMAPSVRPARSAAAGALAAPGTKVEEALAALRKQVEENSEYVGLNFAAEARAIHEGDAPRRSIIGEATPAEARALAEDDIPVARLPWSSSKSN